MTNVGATSGTVGVSQELQSVCKKLESEAIMIQDYVDQISKMAADLENYWEGDDIDTLQAEFETFKVELNNISTVINSIASWGLSAHDAYMSSVQSSKTAISSIFG